MGFATANATKRQDAWGDSARAMGYVALTAKEQAKIVNERHHVVERSKEASRMAWRQAQELDRKHHILERLSTMLQTSWKVVSDFVHEHNLIERSIEAMNKAMKWAIEQMQNKMEDSQYRSATIGQVPNTQSTSRRP